MDNINSVTGYYSSSDLRNILRQLFNQYSLWSRFYIISRIENLEDLEVVTNRLYEVPADIANVLKIYYNTVYIQEFENLMREQITLTIQIISEMKGNQSFDKTKSMWEENADQIANLLASLNPYFDKGTLRNLFYNHFDMLVSEAQKRISKQYALDVYEYNFIEYHSLMFADYLWNGIIKQFYPGN
ncbi:MAG: Acetylglutamate kinase [Lachnoclostridium sp.]|jgi:hypothetical protein